MDGWMNEWKDLVPTYGILCLLCKDCLLLHPLTTAGLNTVNMNSVAATCVLILSMSFCSLNCYSSSTGHMELTNMAALHLTSLE